MGRAGSVAARTAELPAVLVVGVAIAHQGLRYNCAAVVAGGQILGLVPKEKLPTYNIFYEAARSRGSALLLDEQRGVPFGDLVFEFDFGVVGGRGLRGSLECRTGRCAAAPMPARSWSATSRPRPSGSACCRPGAS